MEKEEESAECCEGDKKYKWKRHHKGGAMCGGIYGLVFLGAAVYFVQHAETFWMGVLGIIKAAIWPALIIYKILGLLQF